MLFNPISSLDGLELWAARLTVAATGEQVVKRKTRQATNWPTNRISRRPAARLAWRPRGQR